MKKLSLLILGIAFAIGQFAVQASADDQFSAQMKKFLATEAGQELIGSTAEEYFKTKQQKMRQQAEKQAGADIEEQLKNPTKVNLGSSPSKGPDNAPITIVEFSDFECPFCARGKESIDAVKAQFGDKVRVVFKNMPLAFHKNAEPAAAAALAAGEQGKFWEMREVLFQNQRGLTEDLFVKTAKEMGLDVDRFKKDMKSDSVKKQIEEDKAEAARLGVRGTPNFFVNGVAVRGALPPSHFEGIINRILEDGQG